MQVNSTPSYMTPFDSVSTSGSTNSTSSTTSLDSNSLADPNLFITLLTAQLQAQDPTDPMSPEDMVTQLTEVSSLQQLININQTLTDMATGVNPSSTSSTSSGTD